MNRIVETGAVVATIPYDGTWCPCIRREGQVFGEKLKKVFRRNADAWAYADDIKRKEEETL